MAVKCKELPISVYRVGQRISGKLHSFDVGVVGDNDDGSRRYDVGICLQSK